MLQQRLQEVGLTTTRGIAQTCANLEALPLHLVILDAHLHVPDRRLLQHRDDLLVLALDLSDRHRNLAAATVAIGEREHWPLLWPATGQDELPCEPGAALLPNVRDISVDCDTAAGQSDVAVVHDFGRNEAEDTHDLLELVLVLALDDLRGVGIRVIIILAFLTLGGVIIIIIVVLVLVLLFINALQRLLAPRSELLREEVLQKLEVCIQVGKALVV
mmetsp:Transcript_2770/g.8255  ORF Transcript_2770/g.8255 Transcript_2770/m.8255 type:complete len:217 (-) Transcript_2770:1069-1719(-)